ncbi:MAG: triose-phosphate isomerase, partial [Nanoarchaeota archaeon]|nr:triose-phosphate isomerase [Nanoarchaeota archaeon]
LKMNPVSERSLQDAFSLFRKYLSGHLAAPEREVIVFAPAIFLDMLASTAAEHYHTFPLLKNEQGISLGAQDISQYVSGAHTRQTSPVWLRQMGINDVLIAHSEVRGEYEDLLGQIAGYDFRDGYGALHAIDRVVFNPKMHNALKHGLRVTYCVGETAEEREMGWTSHVLTRQIVDGLAGVSQDDLDNRIIIAYEPRWAIGGDKEPPTAEEIRFAHEVIRGTTAGLYEPRASTAREKWMDFMDNLLILYGGSMKPDNAAAIMAIEGVNGGLIGSACLDPAKFTKIVNYDKAHQG